MEKELKCKQDNFLQSQNKLKKKINIIKKLIHRVLYIPFPISLRISIKKQKNFNTNSKIKIKDINLEIESKKVMEENLHLGEKEINFHFKPNTNANIVTEDLREPKDWVGT